MIYLEEFAPGQKYPSGTLRVDAAAIKAWQQFSTINLPSLTPAQAKAIVGNP